MEGNWKILFYANICINWLVPFLGIMLNKLAKNKNVLLVLGIILMIGQWIDLYMQIMPGATGEMNISFIEIVTYLGFLGLFIFVVSRSLGKAAIIPMNHPYIEESLHHKTH